MATLCRTYTSGQDAHTAVERLLSAGVGGTEIQILMSEAVHDSRDAPVGSYAGTTTADAETVGSYAGAEHSGRAAMGTFAGDANAQRRGGFSDVDRETITTYTGDVRRVRITSHHNLKKLLVDAGLDEATATADVDALHQGRVPAVMRALA